MSDTRTTTRWSVEERAWLDAQAGRTGAKVGTVVRAIVQAAMAAEKSRAAARQGSTAGEGAARAGALERWSLPVATHEWTGCMAARHGLGACGATGDRAVVLLAGGGRSGGYASLCAEHVLEAASRGLLEERSAAVGTVPVGAAPVSPSGAAPARGGTRLDIVVARLLSPGVGPLPPVALMQARQRIKAGTVQVSGHSSDRLDPEMRVGPGEVVLS